MVFLVRGLSSFRLLEFKNKGLGFKVSGIPIQARPSADREIGPRGQLRGDSAHSIELQLVIAAT